MEKKSKKVTPVYMHANGVCTTQLEPLIMWPKHSIGWAGEWNAIDQLNDLCKKHGYGRVPQLAAQIEALWRNPGRRAEFEKARQEHLELCGWKD